MYNVEQTYNRYLKEVGGRIISVDDTSKAIKDTRKSVNITQIELGQMLGRRRETISRIENGSIQPTSRFLKEFTKTVSALKVIRDLFALDEVSRLKGQSINPPSFVFLRSCLNISSKNLELIVDIGGQRYQKKRLKILKAVKEV